MADFIQQMLTANQQLAQPSELQKFVQSLSNQQQEPPDTKQRIDDAILSTTMPQAPNSYRLDFARGLLALKDSYDAAKDDAARQAAQTQANFIRDVANSAGLDLSGYGAGVTREDAAKTLATQEARDVMAALNGQYSKTSDQYYTDTYYSLLQEGYSPRQARKFAGNRAREYQANRVAYLDGVYNSYGRDGLVTNTLGNQMLAQLGMENPSLANFYANSYPGARDAYQRQNQLEDLALAQQFGFENRADTFKYNMASKAADDMYKRNYAQFNNNLQRENTIWGAQFQNEQEEMNYRKKQGRIIDLLTSLGLQGDDLKVAYAKAMGVSLPQKQDKQIDTKVAAEIQKRYEALQKEQENIFKALSDTTTPEEMRESLQARLATIQNTIKDLDTIFGKTFNVQGEQDVKYTGKDEEDLKTLREIILPYMMSHNSSEEQIFNRVREWVHEKNPNVTDWHIQNMIKDALGG